LSEVRTEVHDQGYSRFAGIRRPPAANLWVLAAQGRRRAVAPTLVKLTLFGSVLALFVYPVVFFVLHFAKDPAGIFRLDPVSFVRSVFDWQVWFFAFLVTLSAGSGAIAQDVRTRAFQYYFAKPVTPGQYAFGRMWPLGELVFLLVFAPPALLTMLGAGFAATNETRLEMLGLLFPTAGYALLVAVVLAVTSVATSAFGRSRALTMSTWAAVFFLPHVVALIVQAVSHSDWMRLLSIPSCLGIVGDALFRRAPGPTVRWFHALPALAAWTIAGAYLVRRRLADVETVG
jgi:hypothetical protein